MAEPTVAAAISAIVIAFQSAKDLMQSIRLLDNDWRKHCETAAKEKALMDALDAGENQVSGRYAAVYKELGVQFRIGDGISQQKLLRIAQLINIKITKNLQIAIKFDNAQINYVRVTQDAVLFKRAALGVLEELRSLFIPETLTVQNLETKEVFEMATPDLEVKDNRSSTEFVPIKADKPTPPTEILIQPDNALSNQGSHFSDSDEQSAPRKTALSRMFSKRKNKRYAEFPAAPANLALLKHFDWHGSDLHAPLQEKRKSRAVERMWYTSAEVPVVLDIPRERPKRDSTTLGAWDKWRQQERPATSHDASPQSSFYFGPEPDLIRRDTQLRRQDSVMTDTDGSSTGIARSVSSNGSTPLTSPASETSSVNWNIVPDHAIPIAKLEPPPSVPAIPERSPLRLQRQHSAITSGVSHLPRPATASDSHTPTHQRNVTAGSIAPSVSSSSSILSSMISPSAAQVSLLGRPTKSNNYWGFCKGAWAIREEPKSGLKMQTRPSGMYNTISLWQCRQCSFQSGVVTKKPVEIDSKVYAAAGVLYRWGFLAKSHVKCKNGAKANYGCLFCCVAGRGSIVFGNVDTLMGHIVTEHASRMSVETQQKTKCVYGRVASTHEDFDICIPAPAAPALRSCTTFEGFEERLGLRASPCPAIAS